MVVRAGSRGRDAALVGAFAAALRGGIVVWAQARFPAVEDGHYYDVLAHRLASGAGYTWLWPDGAVTFAAHYPVGYPALLALAYVLFGGSIAVGMGTNALLGAAGAWAAHRLTDAPGTPRWRPIAAGLVVALHPALLPYTPALMTEGVTASLLVLSFALAARARVARRPVVGIVGAGLAVGIATLVRPQSLVLAPVVGALGLPKGATARARAKGAALALGMVLACVAPWTARNCVRMHRCALVSVNAGWNLLIGVQTKSGAWAPVSVPPECATVWDEAGKDTCFTRAAVARIATSPGAWAALAPRKLEVTFDYFGAAPWYLHASNPAAFGEQAKTALGALETLVCRLLLVAALVVGARQAGPRLFARKVVAVGGAIAALTIHGWLGYAALTLEIALVGFPALVEGPIALSGTAAVVAATAAAHAVFFGAGRYGLVVAPFVACLAFLPLTDHAVWLRRPAGWRRLPPVDAARVIAGGAGHVRIADTLPLREESPSSTEHGAG